MLRNGTCFLGLKLFLSGSIHFHFTCMVVTFLHVLWAVGSEWTRTLLYPILILPSQSEYKRVVALHQDYRTYFSESETTGKCFKYYIIQKLACVIVRNLDRILGKYKL
ncbi:hypothetical protein RJT34_27651 [Clitoria ternatea]|uniref:Uncharacterized protein n=1 Tax=Clitoria ternatea TaxID=43366 RepID=A0AAN9FA67_CLITE